MPTAAAMVELKENDKIYVVNKQPCTNKNIVLSARDVFATKQEIERNLSKLSTEASAT